MKAILLAGGKGTRLRPLTIHTPKPIVPIFNRPFLHYQIDLLKQVPEIDEVILSLNYQPRRIEEIFGDGLDAGIKIRYVVEPAPLGTAGAIKYAGDRLTESVVVFNGDVLTQIDLAAVMGTANRQATPEEISRMQAVIDKPMRDGAVGFSTGVSTIVALALRSRWSAITAARSTLVSTSPLNTTTDSRSDSPA